MNRRAALIGAGALALAGVGAWQGYEAWQRGREPSAGAEALSVDLPASVGAPQQAETVETIAATDVEATMRGATPMAQRVAVIGLLNKRNGESRDLRLRPGQAVRIGNAIVRLRACERTAPWEAEQYTGAFVQLDVQGTDDRWRRVFSGWVYKERPALNVVQHPIYDVWPKSCTMSFPETGPDTVTLGSDRPAAKGAASPSRSSASNEPATEGAPSDSPPLEAPSAPPSNAI